MARHSTQGVLDGCIENNAIDLLPPAMPGRIRLVGKHSHSLKFAHARRTATTTGLRINKMHQAMKRKGWRLGSENNRPLRARPGCVVRNGRVHSVTDEADHGRLIW